MSFSREIKESRMWQEFVFFLFTDKRFYENKCYSFTCCKQMKCTQVSLKKRKLLRENYWNINTFATGDCVHYVLQTA